jgi:hypothetical protein
MKKKAGHGPVPEHVELREGHVGRADHERDQEVAERARQQRDHHEEDHDGAVHREEHRVELGRDRPARGGEHPRESRHRAPRPRELVADGHRHHSAEHEEHEAREEELQADHLVVDREDVLAEEAQLVVVVVLAHRAGLALTGLEVRRVRRVRGRGGCNGVHSPSSLPLENHSALISVMRFANSSFDTTVTRPDIL